MSDPDRRVSVLLFEGFEVLDVFGPVELFGRFPERDPFAALHGLAPGDA